MIGVDPMSGGTHRMTSDEFFRRNREQWHYKFDLVFIDGLHEVSRVWHRMCVRLCNGGPAILRCLDVCNSGTRCSVTSTTLWRF